MLRFCPPLHPILVVLFIVLDYDEDLSRITRFHPDWQQHAFYNTNIKFPTDISYLLPPSAGY
jgi:hypothetical protein